MNNNDKETNIVEDIVNRQNQVEEDYHNVYSHEEKELYWTDLVQKLMHNSIIWDWENDRKIDIPVYRSNKSDVDLFVAKMVEVISENFWMEIDDVLKYFILDEEARKALKINSSIHESSTQVTETIDWEKKLGWLSMNNEELSEKVSNLFYEPLAVLLSWISENIENIEISKLLKEASNHILKAWGHCKPYVTDINELEKNSKHTFDVEWIDLSNEQLSRAIAYLENNKLKELLELLSAKINKDWEADKWRERVKLANELFSCAKKLKEVAELI